LPKQSLAWGVCQKEKPLPDVRRADARSAQIGGPDRISQRLQVSANSGEPLAAKTTRNLFSKECWRTALGENSEEMRPEVPIIGKSLLASGAGERLARAGARIDRTIVRPTGEPQGIRPAADSREPVPLAESTHFACRDLLNRSFIYLSVRDQSVAYQVSEPLGCEGVDFVVVRRHGLVFAPESQHCNLPAIRLDCRLPFPWCGSQPLSHLCFENTGEFRRTEIGQKRMSKKYKSPAVRGLAGKKEPYRNTSHLLPI
jgi:hypothetical protein